MKPLLPVTLSLLGTGIFAQAQAQTQTKPVIPSDRPASSTSEAAGSTGPVDSAALQSGEMSLEGEVRGFNSATGEITIAATAFTTATGRKPLAPAKSKVLMTTKDTLFVDRRLETVYSISDLDIGLQVRVVGRDGGTGKPMKARLLEWQSKESPIPPDPDTPVALNGLLPPPKDAKGVKVRVIDAGFQPENRVFYWSKQARPVFFVTYRVFAPRDNKSNRPYYEWGTLKGLRSPDGTFLNSSGAGWNGKTGEGRTLSFPRVNPRWKSVTAIWETTSPNARADASGRYRGQFQLSGALPTRDKPKSEPQTRLETPRGTVFTLQSIECDWEKKTSTYTIAIEKPDGAPDASIDATIQGITDDKNRNLKQGSASHRGTATQVSIVVSAVPEEGAKEAHLSLDVTEQAETWKQKEAYNTVEVEIPVASLVQANPPAESVVAKPDDPEALPVWEAQNDLFSARIESSSKVGNEPRDLRGIVWVAAKPKNATGAATGTSTVETAAYPVALRARNADGQDRELVLFNEEANDVFFHSDGKIPSPGEIAMRFNENGGQEFGTETTLSLDVRSFKRLKYEVEGHSIAVTPNTQQALDKPVGDGGLKLQKIAWIGTEAIDKIDLRTGGAVTFKGNTGLVLVFSRTSIAADAQIKLDGITLRDDTGKMQKTSWATWKGDALSGETDGAWTVVLPPPADGAKSIDIYIRATETGPVEQTSTLTFPNIKL